MKLTASRAHKQEKGDALQIIGSTSIIDQLENGQILKKTRYCSYQTV
jgi:hypothetical protein